MERDVVVIGGGPAGMTAAAVAAEAGAEVVLIDDQATPGGQIYRGIEHADGDLLAILGNDYGAGLDVCRRFRASGADYSASSVVWQVTDDREVAYSSVQGSRLVNARSVILATGAMERPVPVPGWTLPGVMTAGGAQTLLKSASVVADGAVFAGTGPLLYLIALQYFRAGVPIAAVLDTTAPYPLLRAARYLPAALLRYDLLYKGQRWLNELQSGGVRFVRGVSHLRIDGADKVEIVTYRTASGDWQSLETEHVFLHQGVVPNVNLSMSIGLAHDWDRLQMCWRPRVDVYGQSSVAGIYVCGDGAGIGGAVAARAAGEATGIAVLAALGVIGEDDRDQRATGARARVRTEMLVRPFLDLWFRAPDNFRIPQDKDAIVCRCEEVTRAEIAAAVMAGVAGPNQLKAFTRGGMGPCQGRFCGLTVQELIARESGRSPAEVGYYRLRPPIKPVRLDDIANLR